MVMYKNKSYINGVTQALGGISLGAGVLLDLTEMVLVH